MEAAALSVAPRVHERTECVRRGGLLHMDLHTVCARNSQFRCGCAVNSTIGPLVMPGRRSPTHDRGSRRSPPPTERSAPGRHLIQVGFGVDGRIDKVETISFVSPTDRSVIIETSPGVGCPILALVRFSESQSAGASPWSSAYRVDRREEDRIAQHRRAVVRFNGAVGNWESHKSVRVNPW
jgi:hypothetical protein